MPHARVFLPLDAPAACAGLLLAAAATSGCELLAFNETETLGVAGQFSFNVYDDPAVTGEYVLLETASLDVRDESGDPTGTIEEVGPGAFRVTVDPGQVVDLIVASPEHIPTVRRMVGPTTQALPLVPVYPRSPTDLPALIDALAEEPSVDLPDSTAVLQGDASALVIEPLSPDDWAGARLEVVDGDGLAVPFVALTLTESGAYAPADETPVDIVLAPEITPGSVTVSVVSAAGSVTTAQWMLQPGELADGRYFALRVED